MFSDVWNIGRAVWYVAFVCVHPEYQRRGITTRLLEEGMERARADGVLGYVDASEDGKTLYMKLGWEVVGKIREEDGEGGVLESPVMAWYPEEGGEDGGLRGGSLWWGGGSMACQIWLRGNSLGTAFG